MVRGMPESLPPTPATANTGQSPRPAAPQLGGIEWMFLVLLAALWGGSFFSAAVLVDHLPPFTIVLGRVSIAAAVLLVVVHLKGHRMPASFSGWWPLLVMGLVNNAIPFSLIVWGQTRITGGLAAVLIGTTPLFAVLFAHVLTADERLTAGKLAGIVAGLLGVAVLIGPGALEGLGGNTLAQLFVLGAAAVYALAGIFGRRFKGQPAVVTAAGQLTSSTLFMLPVALLIDRPWTLASPPPYAWAVLVIGLAVLATALAYIFYFRILKTAGATNLMLVTLLAPVSAILLGALFIGEAITLHQLAGMALIFTGLAAIDGRVWRWLRRRG